MSSKLVPFESWGVVSSIMSLQETGGQMASTVVVSVVIYEILCQRMAWPWKLVRVRSRSLTMAPFERPHVTFYWSTIVNIALSCTIFELFDVE